MGILYAPGQFYFLKNYSNIRVHAANSPWAHYYEETNMRDITKALIEPYANRKFSWRKARDLIAEDYKDFKQAMPDVETLRRRYEFLLSIKQEQSNRYGSL